MSERTHSRIRRFVPAENISATNCRDPAAKSLCRAAVMPLSSPEVSGYSTFSRVSTPISSRTRPCRSRAGSGNGPAPGKARIMAGHLSGGGLETRYKDDVEKDIWDKVVTNAAVNATCGVLRLNVRQLYGHPEGRRLMHDLTAESVKVAAAMGIVLDLDAAFRRIEVAATVHGDHYPSMAQDMKNRRKTEIDSVNGAISRYGRQAGIPTPANDLLTRLVKIIEENYESQF